MNKKNIKAQNTNHQDTIDTCTVQEKINHLSKKAVTIDKADMAALSEGIAFNQEAIHYDRQANEALKIHDPTDTGDIQSNLADMQADQADLKLDKNELSMGEGNDYADSESPYKLRGTKGLHIIRSYLTQDHGNLIAARGNLDSDSGNLQNAEMNLQEADPKASLPPYQPVHEWEQYAPLGRIEVAENTLNSYQQAGFHAHDAQIAKDIGDFKEDFSVLNDGLFSPKQHAHHHPTEQHHSTLHGCMPDGVFKSGPHAGQSPDLTTDARRLERDVALFHQYNERELKSVHNKFSYDLQHKATTPPKGHAPDLKTLQADFQEKIAPPDKTFYSREIFDQKINHLIEDERSVHVNAPAPKPNAAFSRKTHSDNFSHAHKKATHTPPHSSGQSDNTSPINDQHNEHVHSQDLHCFLAGTLIKTTQGNIPIEKLEAGMGIEQVNGPALTLIEVTKQTVNAENLSQRNGPVKISAGSLAPNLPARDLYVSAAHAFPYIDKEKRITLVQARHLTNKRTIRPFRPAGLSTLTYYHVRLKRHALIFANEAPTESYFSSKKDQAFPRVNLLGRLTPKTYLPQATTQE